MEAGSEPVVLGAQRGTGLGQDHSSIRGNGSHRRREFQSKRLMASPPFRRRSTALPGLGGGRAGARDTAGRATTSLAERTRRL